MRPLENTFKSVLGAPTSYLRKKTVLVITRFCFSPKMLVGENASILCAEQFSLCVTVVITGFALGHVFVHASILHTITWPGADPLSDRLISCLAT